MFIERLFIQDELLFFSLFFRDINSPDNTEFTYWIKTIRNLLHCCSFIPKVKTKKEAGWVIYQSEQGHSRKFDKLPHFSSSVPTEGVLSFLQIWGNLRLFTLNLIKYLITILSNLSYFTLMLLLCQKLKKKNKVSSKSSAAVIIQGMQGTGFFCEVAGDAIHW